MAEEKKKERKIKINKNKVTRITRVPIPSVASFMLLWTLSERNKK